MRASKTTASLHPTLTAGKQAQHAGFQIPRSGLVKLPQAAQTLPGTNHDQVSLLIDFVCWSFGSSPSTQATTIVFTIIAIIAIIVIIIIVIIIIIIIAIPQPRSSSAVWSFDYDLTLPVQRPTREVSHILPTLNRPALEDLSAFLFFLTQI